MPHRRDSYYIHSMSPYEKVNLLGCIVKRHFFLHNFENLANVLNLLHLLSISCIFSPLYLSLFKSMYLYALLSCAASSLTIKPYPPVTSVSIQFFPFQNVFSTISSERKILYHIDSQISYAFEV